MHRHAGFSGAISNRKNLQNNSRDEVPWPTGPHHKVAEMVDQCVLRH